MPLMMIILQKNINNKTKSMPSQVHGNVVDRSDGRVGVAGRQHTSRTPTAGTGRGLQQRGSAQEARQA